MEISLNKADLAGALPALGKLVSRTSLIKAYHDKNHLKKLKLLSSDQKVLVERYNAMLF